MPTDNNSGSHSNTAQDFAYRQHPQDIHEFIFFKASVPALDQCFAHLGQILSNAALEQPILLLSDIRQSGTPPVQQLWPHSRRLLEKHPQHPVIYNAVVHKLDSTVARMLMVVMEQLAGLYQAKVQFFLGDTREQAIDWLLQSTKVDLNQPSR